MTADVPEIDFDVVAPGHAGDASTSTRPGRTIAGTDRAPRARRRSRRRARSTSRSTSPIPTREIPVGHDRRGPHRRRRADPGDRDPALRGDGRRTRRRRSSSSTATSRTRRRSPSLGESGRRSSSSSRRSAGRDARRHRGARAPRRTATASTPRRSPSTARAERRRARPRSDAVTGLSLRNPIAILMLCIALVVFAGVVTPRMSVDTFPELTPPVLVIGTLAPGPRRRRTSRRRSPGASRST